jgi:hypothetical protein
MTCLLNSVNAVKRSRSRSVSKLIVSDYGLADRAIGVRSPADVKDFSSNLCVQTGSETHPASCTMGTESPFPGAKAGPRRDADSSPHLVLRSWMSRSYTSSPPSASVVCSGTALLERSKGKAVAQHTYGGAGGRGSIAPTHSRPQH